MPAAPIIIGGLAASGAAAAIGTAILGATISTAVATAVGVGVLSAGATAIQGGSSSDILRSAVLGGVGSYVGGMVASKVSSAVSQATGAPLGGGISGTVTAGGQFASTAGGTGFGAAGAAAGLQTAAGAGSILGVAAPTFAGFLAGNVAGRATEAAITGKDIGNAALFGAAQSVGFGLNQLEDFKSLPPAARNVLTSATQAAVMGQDVGDAVIESLIVSTDIVTKALKTIPGGIEFTEENPAVTKYVVNSVSSALAAQLQGKEVSDAVLASLVRTTANVLNDKFQDAQLNEKINQTNSAYNQAVEQEKKIAELAEKIDQVQARHKGSIAVYEQARSNLEGYIYYANYYSGLAADALAQARDPKGGRTVENALEWLNFYNSEVEKNNEGIRWSQESVRNSEAQLRAEGYFRTIEPLQSEYNDALRTYNALSTRINTSVDDLMMSSEELFSEFDNKLGITLSEFEEDTITGQDLLAQISPVAPPSSKIGVEVAGPVSPDILGRLQSMPLFGETVYRETETPAEPGSTTGTMNMRFVEGFRTNGTPYYYAIATFENGDVRYVAYQDGEPTIFDNRPNLKTSGAGIGDVAVDAEGGEEGQTGQTGVGTGTPGAPAIDYSLIPQNQAQTPVVDPSYTVGFDLRDYGPGSPLSPNLALFEIGGGRGTPGGLSTETTFNLVTRNTRTGEETYNVGGKQYSLIVLPDKQVLVPKEPSEVVIYLERDPVTNLPKMKEIPAPSVPRNDAIQIAAKVGQAEGGAPAGAEGAEGATGGMTAERPTIPTTQEQLQPGVRPDQVAPGSVTEVSAPSFPTVATGMSPIEIPPPRPGGGAGSQPIAAAPGAGGVGEEITDEDIMQMIRGDIEDVLGGTGTERTEEAGGGEGEGMPGEEGEGTGAGEEGEGFGAGAEGEGPGAGGEGTGTGRGGEGTGTGTGTGTGGGEGGGEITVSPDVPPVITTVSRPRFARRGDMAPYRVTGQDESGILGRKQPLFGGDEDLQRAEWNRRSLRLRRLLGL